MPKDMKIRIQITIKEVNLIQFIVYSYIRIFTLCKISLSFCRPLIYLTEHAIMARSMSNNSPIISNKRNRPLEYFDELLFTLIIEPIKAIKPRSIYMLQSLSKLFIKPILMVTNDHNDIFILIQELYTVFYLRTLINVITTNNKSLVILILSDLMIFYSESIESKKLYELIIATMYIRDNSEFFVIGEIVILKSIMIRTYNLRSLIKVILLNKNYILYSRFASQPKDRFPGLLDIFLSNTINRTMSSILTKITIVEYDRNYSIPILPSNRVYLLPESFISSLSINYNEFRDYRILHSTSKLLIKKIKCLFRRTKHSRMILVHRRIS